MLGRGEDFRDEDFLDRKLGDLASPLQDVVADRHAFYALKARDRASFLLLTIFALLLVAAAGAAGFMVYQGAPLTDARIEALAKLASSILGPVAGVVGMIVGFYFGAASIRRR